MGKPNITSLGAVQPVNTLNGHKRASLHPAIPISSTPFATDADPPPPSKRQKTDSHFPLPSHTTSRFALAPTETDNSIVSNSSRKRQRGRSQSAESQWSNTVPSANARVTETQVQELRNIYQFTKPLGKPRQKRLRRDHGSTKLEQHDGSSEGQPVLLDPLPSPSEDDSVEEVDMLSCEAGEVSKRKPRKGTGAEFTLDQVGKRFVKPGPGTGPRRRIIDGLRTPAQSIHHPSGPWDADDLAPDNDELQKDGQQRRKPNSSLSLSKRGDIQPTKFMSSGTPRTDVQILEENDILGAGDEIASGLFVAQGVSGKFRYPPPNEDDAPPCLLYRRQISHTLHPVGHDKEILPSLSFLTVNLTKIDTLRYASTSECCIVCIKQAFNVTTFAGPLLMLKFSKHQEVNTFVRWVKSQSHNTKTLVMSVESSDKLSKEFENSFGKAKEGAVKKMEQSPLGTADDIELIRHNRGHQHQMTPSQPRSQHNTSLRLKAKDVMRQSDVPESPSNDRIEWVYSDLLSRDRPERASRRVTERSLTRFALDSPQPEPEPEPEKWTTKNPGWEKNWRNSLVFPPQGKNRAIVDKDDIHRLNEGEFLNDNLVIFYLRFLQNELESNRPELASRIYFQNTFFYDKLKSGRTSQGIDYDSVKAWTSKVDLFTKDYIIVPINEYAHWYIAIIYNAPKLIPSNKPDNPEGSNAHQEAAITIDDDSPDDVQHPPVISPTAKTFDGKTETEEKDVEKADVVDRLRRMSICSQDGPSSEPKQTTGKQPSASENDLQVTEKEEAHEAKESTEEKADVEQTPAPNDQLSRKKSRKRTSIGVARRHDPDQPRIITLDSLGGAHSPACIILKQYLVAELKDKKGIEIPPLGPLGMTAKNAPLQTNYCDCGLYLLGYIQAFLEDPDQFVRSILTRTDDIEWNLDPSKLRNDMRELVFRLQEEQQGRENDIKEEKRRGRKKPKNMTELSKSSPPPIQKAHVRASLVRSPPRDRQAARETLQENKPKSETPKSEVPDSMSEQTEAFATPHLSGSAPTSPTVQPEKVESRHQSESTSIDEAIQKQLLEPLRSSRGSSPGNPNVIADSRTVRDGTVESAKAPARNPYSRSPIEVHILPTSQSRQRDRTSRSNSISEARSEKPERSPYFKEDEKVTVTLRKDPRPPLVVDISD
ncbi:hypothetical protein F4778DRAFT_714025 [Xylariomycetidae sp. FL2044]|nr:hypothetical protein F4778DRAFT_714025 [Xylariomycetidae sp. FL2044]